VLEIKLKLTQHIYTSNKDKWKHFWGGLLTWWLAGSPIYAVIFFFIAVSGAFGPGLNLWVIRLKNYLPFIILVAGFAVTKHWIAFGLAANLQFNLVWVFQDLSISPFEIEFLVYPFPLVVFT